MSDLCCSKYTTGRIQVCTDSLPVGSSSHRPITAEHGISIILTALGDWSMLEPFRVSAAEDQFVIHATPPV